jgi:hypothetical protein
MIGTILGINVNICFMLMNGIDIDTREGKRKNIILYVL